MLRHRILILIPSQLIIMIPKPFEIVPIPSHTDEPHHPN